MSALDQCICSAPQVRRSFSDHFDALHCIHCGSKQFVTAPGVAPRDFRYNGDNDKYSQREYLYGSQLRWAHTELLKDCWSGRKVLEVGCYNGFFLYELSKRGAEVFGFDVNQDALAVGRELFGLEGRIYASMTDIATLSPFDDVVCIDIVEHLDNPAAFIAEMAALLKPNGRLFVAGPTLERGFHDKSDYPPHHKWWFSRPGLVACIQRCGFIITSTSVQRDGILFLRNFLGKLIHGIGKREFYGEAVIAGPALDGAVSRRVYAALSWLGTAVFSVLGISYCSSIITANRSDAL